MAYEGPLTYSEWLEKGKADPNSLVNRLPQNTYTSLGKDYTSTYNYATPTAGGLGVGQWEVPKIQLPDYSKMTSLTDYTGRIGEYAKMATEAGLKSLGELTFKPEYELERERQESRGLVGSGVENKNLQNLLTSQQARAGEFATNIYNKAFEQQTAELQALRGLQFEKDKMQMSQAFDAAMKRGDWQQAKNIHDDDIKMDLEDLRQRNEQFREENRLEIEKFKDDAAYREWDAKYKNDVMLLDAYEAETGFSLDEYRMQLEEERLFYDEGVAAGYKDKDLINFVNDKMKDQGYEGTTRTADEANTVQASERQGMIDAPAGTKISESQLLNAGANIQPYKDPKKRYDAVAYVGNTTWYRIPNTPFIPASERGMWVKG